MFTSVSKFILDSLKLLMLSAVIWTLALGFSVIVFKPSLAEGDTGPRRIAHIQKQIQKQRTEEMRIQRIHRTVQKMVKNRALLNRVEEKLRTFDDEKLRLIDTLCLRMAENPDDPSADIAFLLVTGLIMM